MFDAMALSPVFPFDHSAQLPKCETEPHGRAFTICAATFISRATSEPARGTFHHPAGGRPLSAARLRPAIPDRPAFPARAHPRAVSPVCGTAAPQDRKSVV